MISCELFLVVEDSPVIMQRNPSYNALDALETSECEVSGTYVVASAGSGGDQTMGKYKCSYVCSIVYNITYLH